MPVILLGGALPGPDSVAGLTGWWDAGVGVYSDAGTTPAVDNDTVQQWNDRSGGGNNLSQGTAGNRPTFKTGIVNGAPVVRFGGVTDDDYMSGAALSTFFANNAKTAFVVAKHTANASDALIGDQTNDFLYLEFISTGATLRADNYDGTSDNADKGALSPGSWYICTLWHDGVNIKSGANDTRDTGLASTASGNTNSMAGTFGVGRRTAGTPDYPDADIAEVITYNVALSEASRQVIERYLAAKYGITLPY